MRNLVGRYLNILETHEGRAENLPETDGREDRENVFKQLMDFVEGNHIIGEINKTDYCYVFAMRSNSFKRYLPAKLTAGSDSAALCAELCDDIPYHNMQAYINNRNNSSKGHFVMTPDNTIQYRAVFPCPNGELNTELFDFWLSEALAEANSESLSLEHLKNIPFSREEKRLGKETLKRIRGLAEREKQYHAVVRDQVCLILRKCPCVLRAEKNGFEDEIITTLFVENSKCQPICFVTVDKEMRYIRFNAVIPFRLSFESNIPELISRINHANKNSGISTFMLSDLKSVSVRAATGLSRTDLFCWDNFENFFSEFAGEVGRYTPYILAAVKGGNTDGGE